MEKQAIRVVEVEELAEVAVDRLVRYGESMVSFSLRNPDVILPVKREITRKAIFLNSVGVFRKHGVDDGWKNVKRVTFFGSSNLADWSNKHRYVARLFSSRLWLPDTELVKNRFADALSACGKASSNLNGSDCISSIANLDFNRVGINRMNGRPGDKALIVDYVSSPAEVGAVVVMDLFREGMSQANYLIDNNVTVIFGKNTCDELGIEQTVNGLETAHFRLSATFAELQPNTKP
jgi:hypothetical protein